MRSLSSAKLARLVCASPARVPTSRRLLAAPRAQSNDEKPPTWGDLARLLACSIPLRQPISHVQIFHSTFRGVVKKLSDGVSSLLRLPPSDEKRSKPAPYEPRLPSSSGLIGGLLGRAAGSLLGAAVQTLAKEVSEAGNEAPGCCFHVMLSLTALAVISMRAVPAYRLRRWSSSAVL